jgi:hypothetical protein
MLHTRIDCGASSIHSFTSVMDHGMPVKLAILKLPENKSPGIGIDRKGTINTPHHMSMHINHTQVSPSAVIAIHLIRGQSTGSGGYGRIKPSECTPLGFVNDLAYGVKAHVLTTQSSKADLNTPMAGVSIGIEGQNPTLDSGCDHSYRAQSKRLLQSPLPLPLPAIKSLAGHTDLFGHCAHKPVFAAMSDQLAHPLDTLGRNARMSAHRGNLPLGMIESISLMRIIMLEGANQTSANCQAHSNAIRTLS